MGLGARLWLSCVIAAAPLQAAPSYAAEDLRLVFPLASSNSRIAAERMGARADAVIRSQACGQEPNFVSIRAELKDKKYDHQGEGFTNILIAKIQWLPHPERGPARRSSS